jgi:hypothetical protein
MELRPEGGRIRTERGARKGGQEEHGAHSSDHPTGCAIWSSTDGPTVVDDPMHPPRRATRAVGDVRIARRGERIRLDAVGDLDVFVDELLLRLQRPSPVGRPGAGAANVVLDATARLVRPRPPPTVRRSSPW